MRNVCLAGCLLLAALTGGAAVCDVRAYGAKGDGVSYDTAAIQSAVDAAGAAGGGEVLLPAGTYLSGTVYLKDGIDFHLAAGAVLLGSTREADYNRWNFCPQNRKSEMENTNGGHLLVAVGCRNIVLRGPGRIDGNARFFAADARGRAYPRQKDIPWRPGQMVFFTDCDGVRIHDIELSDSPYWTCFLHGCNRVDARRLNVHSLRNPYSHNGDGIDIDCCQHVSVRDSRFDTSDDCIAIRGNARPLPNPQDCAYVTVSNCTLSSDKCAIRVGVGNGTIRDVDVTDITVTRTRTAISFCPNWTKDGGSVSMHNLRFSRFRIDCASFCRLIARHAAGVRIGDVEISDVSGTTTEPAYLFARPGYEAAGFLFRNIDVPNGIETYCVKDVRIEGGTLKMIEQTPARQEELKAMAEDPYKYPHT